MLCRLITTRTARATTMPLPLKKLNQHTQTVMPFSQNNRDARSYADSLQPHIIHTLPQIARHSRRAAPGPSQALLQVPPLPPQHPPLSSAYRNESPAHPPNTLASASSTVASTKRTSQTSPTPLPTASTVSALFCGKTSARFFELSSPRRTRSCFTVVAARFSLLRQNCASRDGAQQVHGERASCRVCRRSQRHQR